MPQRAFNRTELRDNEVFYVLELRVASRTYVISTSARVADGDTPARPGFTQGGITKDDGTVVQVLDGLGPVAWTDSIRLGNTAPEVRKVSLEVSLPDVDWAELEADGFDLAFAQGELSRIIQGQTWEKRQLLLTGSVQEATYGAKGETLAFTIKAVPFEDRSQYPPPTAFVDSTTWPNADDPAQGQYYPTPIGYPGNLDGGTVRVAGSPGLVVDTVNRYLLIAIGRVDATTVDVRNITTLGSWTSISVDHRQDGRGRTVATVTLASHTAGDEYVVSWGTSVASASGGGILNRRETGPLRSAGDVLEYFLNLSTLKVDRGRTAAAVDLLQGYLIDGYWDDPCTVWEWIQGNLLPILPVSIQSGPDGLYPVVWQYDVENPDTVQQIDVSRGDGYRVGPVTKSTTLYGQLANEFTIRYGLNARTGKYIRQHTVHGDADATSTFNYRPSVACRESRSRELARGFSQASVMNLSSDLIGTRSTADAVASWKSLLHALPTRQVSYRVPITYDTVRVGAAVALTDSELSLSSEHCLVVEKEDLDNGELVLGLVILPARLDA